MTVIAYVHSPILAKVLSILLKLDIELPRISEKGGAIQDLILIRFNFYVYVLLFIICSRHKCRFIIYTAHLKLNINQSIGINEKLRLYTLVLYISKICKTHTCVKVPVIFYLFFSSLSTLES